MIKIEILCDGSVHSKVNGWPNRIDDKGKSISPINHVEVGQFNSPHGIASDREGNIYVHEWHMGVRLTKLRRLA